MIDNHAIHVFELVLGVLIIAAMFLRLWFGRMGAPSLVGFILLGFVVRLIDSTVPFLTEASLHILEFLASTGIFILLFRVGLDSNVHGLVSKLPRAAPIWIGNVVLSGLPAYLVCDWWLGLALVPSIFVAVAMTATSIAVSTEMWREADALDSADAETLIDVAELDDLSGVALLALALAVVPALHFGDGRPVLAIAGDVTLVFVVKVALFGTLCALLARYGERHIVAALRATGEPSSALILIGVGLIIAAVASLLGFSIAIGAFFAGLVFSRDPEAVRLETGFLQLRDFFVPFFFIAIGFRIDPASLGSAMGIGGALLVVAVLGKVIGAGVPALLTTGGTGALLIGVSMVPRAEIAMVIGQQARELGDWAMPAEVYSGIALVSLATCLVTPFAVRALLRQRAREVRLEE
ncbi:MAG: cation:proton antiporter [Alphaproteobacteria bacterium]|jgi:Kef-type K+ transport system membrane component KefB|nr:cation:proton antiporter [Alphaproteobacteria bacterium]